eukprot:jgi/Phyca11/13343/fgenesh1_pg.PHYCAscaffold_3_\
MVSKPSATVVESDTEFLSTGVSHEKAKRFSVQEWMANSSPSQAQLGDDNFGRMDGDGGGEQQIREELATKLKADEEAEIERQCTFKPKTNPTEKVKAKYMEAKATSSPSLTAASREAAAKELAECTFYPKEQKEERARQFKNFIERQRFHEQARHKRIELTKQQLTPGYKPTINKKSLAMMENGRKGDFLERISSYALRKEHDNIKKKTVRSADPNCTFKPAINQASTKRKPRSITELSRGDLLRRETTQRLMKLKMEQEEMAALTFRPQLNRKSERHEGRLKILSNPDTYLQRIQQQSQAHTIKQRRALQEKEMGEFAECTFKPRTIEAPAYVQRIARSVSLTKALRAQQQAAARAKEKPEWK